MKNINLQKKLLEISAYFLEKGYFAGAVVRVEQERTLISECAVGYSLCDGEKKEPMSTTTLFDIASLTKLFTTTVILRFATLGIIDIDRSFAAQSWAEPFLIAAQDHPEILAMYETLTPSALLTHSSGLPAWYPFYAAREQLHQEAADARERLIPSDFTAILHRVLRSSPLQKKTVYSDINFMLLGMAAACIGRCRLDEVIFSSLIKPLRLGATTYTPIAAQTAATEFGNRIEMQMTANMGLSFSKWRPLSRPLRGEANDGNAFYYFSGIAGHAGLFSTAEDLCNLCQLYVPEDAAEENMQDFIAPPLLMRATTDAGAGRGLGFQFSQRYPHGFGHTGFTGTMVYIHPREKLTAVILTNRLHVPAPQDIDAYRMAIVEAIDVL